MTCTSPSVLCLRTEVVGTHMFEQPPCCVGGSGRPFCTCVPLNRLHPPLPRLGSCELSGCTLSHFQRYHLDNCIMVLVLSLHFGGSEKLVNVCETASLISNATFLLPSSRLPPSFPHLSPTGQLWPVPSSELVQAVACTQRTLHTHFRQAKEEACIGCVLEGGWAIRDMCIYSIYGRLDCLYE